MNTDILTNQNINQDHKTPKRVVQMSVTMVHKISA